MSDHKPKRNFKLWNHWIAEVRDLGLKAKVYFEDEEDSKGNPRYATKTTIKYIFDKALMYDYFENGETPGDAFFLETSSWDSY